MEWYLLVSISYNSRGSELKMKDFKDEELKEILGKVDKISLSMLRGEARSVEQVGKLVEEEFDEDSKTLLVSFLLSERFIERMQLTKKIQEKQKENSDAMFG